MLCCEPKECFFKIKIIMMMTRRDSNLGSAGRRPDDAKERRHDVEFA